MLTYALILFALAAVGGAFMAFTHKQGKPIPMILAIGHGILAALGLVIVLVEVAGGTASGQVGTALVLFLGAAIGGFYLFSLHLRKKPQSMALILVHGTVAVLGFLVLLFAVI